MKLFAVRNDKEWSAASDFELNNDCKPYNKSNGKVAGSNAHSGGVVILAESLEEANKIMEKNCFRGTLTEITFEKSGVVLSCDGDC